MATGLIPVASFAQPLAVPEAAANICAPCHTVDGMGRDIEIPNLAGQHGIYLVNQLKAFKSGARKHVEMKFIARELSEAEMRELADYYASLPGR
eukprot:gene14334-14457_t